MKILDEYVIILNILLFSLLLYNFIQKMKIIEGHGTPEETANSEKGKSANKKGDNMIKSVVNKEKEAAESSKNSEKNYNDTDWDGHEEAAEERDKEIAALN